MSLPIDLILIRHGESEGNAAKRLSEKGDHSAFNAINTKRHSRSFSMPLPKTLKRRGAAAWLFPASSTHLMCTRWQQL